MKSFPLREQYFMVFTKKIDNRSRNYQRFVFVFIIKINLEEGLLKINHQQDRRILFASFKTS